MKVKPLFNNILVKRLDEESKTKGGIIIPDTAKEKPSRGKVISIGDGAVGEDGKKQPMTVKAGDTVLFTKWGGTEVKLDGEDYVIMKETDVLGTIED
ncbi:MAG: co-chaperone GroES [Rickettsiales bacterium]|jgi:chaperonin GroES|nr:co-chaperone GroES [Rickettsiales bacterium]